MMTDTFDLISTTDLPEYKSTGYYYKHRKTGCQVFHVKNSDTDNLFAFIFQTPALNNCGTAHIMEHSVLAGSRRFPVKDPFQQLMKGSVNTFMNAMTYPDRTVFPASSTIEKDYFNLMLVYGDAVFFPLLRKETFMQERNIVCNEMKGNYSDQAGILDEYSRRILFPDTAYKYDSGGVPEDIPSLTYEEFLAFHRKYYSPSNCRIFLYGNIDTEKQLAFLEKEFLCQFDSNTGESPCVPLQKKYDRLFRFDTACSAAGDEDSGCASVNWLCGETASIDYKVKARLLSDILLDNPSSLLYRRIMESDIADDVASVTGVSTSTRQAVFSVGVRGIEKDRVEEFETFIEDSLKEIAAEPIDPLLVEASLSKADFRIKEQKVRYGMILLSRIMPGWLYGGSPVLTLCMNQAFERVKSEYQADSLLFNKFIEKELLANRHHSLVSVFPGQAESGQEAVSSDDTAEDTALFEAYKKSSDNPEDLKKIPALHKSDIPYDVEKPTFVKSMLGPDTCYVNNLFTGGIVYTDLFFDLSGMDDSSLLYVPLLCALLEEVGLPGMPYYDVASRLDTLAGSWCVSTCCESCVSGGVQKRVMVRIASLEAKVQEAARFMSQVLHQGQVTDLERIKNVITSIRNDLKEMISYNGSLVAMVSASGKFSESDHTFSLWQGLEQLQFLEMLNTDDNAMMEQVAQMLLKLQSYIFGQRKVINIICQEGYDADSYSRYLETLFVPGGESSFGKAEPFAPCPASECYVTSAMVSYNAMAFPIREYKLDLVREAALSHIISTGKLWESVRMEGGAYGASASSDFISRLFLFSSYRDPSIEKTFDAFVQSLAHTAENGMTEETLEQNIITMAGKELKPRTPEMKGLEECIMDMRGITWDLRKKRREVLLRLSVHDIMEAADSLKAASDGAALVTIAGRQSMEKEKAFLERKGFRITDISI